MARLNQQGSVGDPRTPPLHYPCRCPWGPDFAPASHSKKKPFGGNSGRENCLEDRAWIVFTCRKKNLWYHGELLLRAFWLMWAAEETRPSLGQGSACLRLIWECWWATGQRQQLAFGFSRLSQAAQFIEPIRTLQGPRTCVCWLHTKAWRDLLVVGKEELASKDQSFSCWKRSCRGKWGLGGKQNSLEDRRGG